MNGKNLTVGFTLVALILVLGFDAYQMFNCGGACTISWITYQASKDYPIIGVLVGIVIGHIFWTMKPEPNDK